MKINHNIAALNTYSQLSSNTLKTTDSMEKLSSGLRINRAGDDAAGLAISEKMRGQIRGLEQASKNAQDGISLIQTAEGALNETHSILQRMRELAVQASNDTNTVEDRKEIQKEINQLTSEVNRVGNTTEFNTKKLLNAGGFSAEAVDNVINGLKGGWLEAAENRIDTFFGITGKNLQSGGSATKLEIVLYAGEKYETLASVGGTYQKLELNIDLLDFDKGDGENGNNHLGKEYNDRIIAHEMVHAVMNDAFGTKTRTMQSWFKEGTAEFIQGADERLKRVLGGSSANPTKITDLANRAKALLDGAEWEGDDLDYAAGYMISKYIFDNKASGTDMISLMQAIKNDTSSATGAIAVESAIGSYTSFGNFATFGSNFDSDIQTYITNYSSTHLDWGTDETDTGAIGGSAHGGSPLSPEDVVDESGTTQSDQPLKHFQVIWPTSIPTSNLQLQIGANENQSMKIELEDMRARALKISGNSEGAAVVDGVTAYFTKVDGNNGVTNGTSNTISEYALDVSTHEKATAAIKIYDQAIEKVSSFRSKLGANQNRLEHTINNLGTSAENLTAAESRIRDVDMAKEMMNQTKSSILSQAAQAMLAQANQQPQGILQLLR
jgi:flagellin